MERLRAELLREKKIDGELFDQETLPDPDRRSPERVLQFGGGNFLRAFADWMVDVANERCGFDGSVLVARPVSRGDDDLINDQDGLFTLLVRGMENGETVERRHLVGSISRSIKCRTEWDAYLKAAEQEALRFIISNTTEAGIVYTPEKQPDSGQAPSSFPAKLTAFLHRRFEHFDEDKEKGFIVLPCELIENNGAKLRDCVMKYADDWKLGDAFAEWLSEANVFCNTLVDRIVPGYPSDEIEAIQATLGYEDRLLVTSEPYLLWVIEAPESVAAEIPFHRLGLNVVLTDDLTPWRTQKVRVLNGAHTSSVLAAFLAGLDTVGEMMDDELLGAYVRRNVFDEILPVLHMDSDAARAYAESVMERFQNPFIRHELLSISLNSVSKWKVRVLPSLLDGVDRFGKCPKDLAISLAALIRFYRGTFSDGKMSGSREAEAYPIRDDEDVLEFFAEVWDEHGDDMGGLVNQVLSRKDFWDRDLNRVPGLANIVTTALEAIEHRGMRKALEELLKEEQT